MAAFQNYGHSQERAPHLRDARWAKHDHREAGHEIYYLEYPKRDQDQCKVACTVSTPPSLALTLIANKHLVAKLTVLGTAEPDR